MSNFADKFFVPNEHNAYFKSASCLDLFMWFLKESIKTLNRERTLL